VKRFLNIVKKVLQILFVVGVVVAFIITIVAAVNKQKTYVCSSIHIDVDYPEDLQLIEEDEILYELQHLTRGKLIGKPLALIDFRTLENVIEKNPYVANAEVFYDQSHVLHVTIQQRRPFLRVINNDDVSYYLSEDRYKMPLHDKFTTDVPLAFGYIDAQRISSKDSVVKAQLFDLVLCLEKDSFLSSMIDHVYVHESGDFELFPRIGGSPVWFGKVDEHINRRFENLKEFYKAVMMRKGWNAYKQINIESALQVVAVKRMETQ
jgi:cell division protein FtsQ